MKINNILATLCALTLLISSIGCAKKDGFQTPSTDQSSTSDPTPEDTTEDKAPTPAPPQPPQTEAKTYPLLWEAAQPQGKNWTAHVFTLIQQQTPHLVQGADDIAQFCPRYSTLTTPERVNFWGLLISAMVKYESGFNPASRMLESTMGTDPVTGKRVYSEGLLQLSYQDVRPYPFCDEFDWNRDKHLDPADPRKTILDPYKNLNCGVRILAQQIKNKGRITLSSGVYWSVIKINGKYSKIPQIAALTKKMPGCMN